MPAQESNKAKIAKRVIEVLDFFDDSHPTATVMDIVRRYDRPQSSTSELLSTLVELGILYKDNASRSYTLTPRAAILGTTANSGDNAIGTTLNLSKATNTRLALGTEITSKMSNTPFFLENVEQDIYYRACIYLV